MANAAHLRKLAEGVKPWNKWREDNPDVKPDLSDADLSERMLPHGNFQGADLSRANLTGAALENANLTEANLQKADLTGATVGMAGLTKANLRGANLEDAVLNHACLEGADLEGVHAPKVNLWAARLGLSNLTHASLFAANLYGADLRYAKLIGAELHDANLGFANLAEADLEGANLQTARLTDAVLTNANLNNCYVYGISAWNLQTDGTKQSNLVVTYQHVNPLFMAEKEAEPTVTVDSIEVAQFIYLLLNNQKIRHVIDTITSKVVLILGRFTPARKAILDAIREELRQHDYLPVMFDFDKPAHRDTVETVSTLAHMARFIIADLTGARSVLQELQRIVPALPSVPVQPLIHRNHFQPGMIDHMKAYRSFLEMCTYSSADELIGDLQRLIIDPAEAFQ